MLWIGVVVVILLSYTYIHSRYRIRLLMYIFSDNNINTFYVYNHEKVWSLTAFFRDYQKEYFELSNAEFGTCNIQPVKYYIELLPSTPTKFSFPEHNISGEINLVYTPKMCTTLSPDNKIINFELKKLGVKIRITSVKKISLVNFINLLHQISREDYSTRENKQIDIRGFRHFSGINHIHIFLNQSGERILYTYSKEYDKSIFFRNVYSPVVPLIKRLISKNPDISDRNSIKNNRCNILLYGPSGTGKSMIITEVAKYTKRFVLCFDLKILSRKQLYVNSHIPLLRGFSRLPKEFIIVLENLDLIIEEISKNERSGRCSDISTLEISELSAAPNEDPVKITDLIELLNSNIYPSDRIVIATTRNIEKIPESVLKYLELIHINYVSGETFRNILSKEFPDIHESEYITLPKDHSIPTSKIMEFIRTSDDYTEFCSRILL